MNNLFGNITPLVKNLIIINVLMFIASQVLGSEFVTQMAGHYFQSPFFKPWQVVTHMFMHGGIGHIFFNMYALVLFGPRLEHKFGGKRFLQYYMITGLGAFILHYLVVYLQLTSVAEFADAEVLSLLNNEGARLVASGRNYTDEVLGKLNGIYNGSVVGASGAVFGILLAYGMTYPNEKIMLMFPPIPMKVKHFVMGYGALELYMGIANNPGDNTAHFAHLGGMLFGFILLKIWNKKQNNWEY